MTPTLLSAFWTYTLITAMTPGPNNILALSSATSHGFRQSTRVLAGMSLGFLIVMLLCAGISFSLAVIDPAAVHLLSWAGAAYIVWLAWKIATSPTKEDGLQTKTNQFLGQLCFAVCERQNHFVRCYGTVDVCSAANTGAKLGSWRQRFAGDDWDVWQCVLGAGGASVSAIVSPVWSPVKYRACPVAGLLRGTHFLLTKKSGRGRPLPLSNLLLKPYRLSVKVRAITSRCCSGVRELKRTA
ncbi:putative transporter [Escherichia coli]|uniref:Putative transporter n=5 Tax=Enterobacteriaceae TaxID=543 RepID=A0A377K288_ECOLX|nr:putative transporter [Escherichia coli]